jgi:ATP-binding cassette subfamily F protein 3
LLGANGNGKSTMIKLIAGKLTPMQGEMLRSGKLRIGYFSQHQTEELDVDSTPYQEMYRLMATKNSNVKESQIRAKLGQFHFSKDLADNRIGSLSGGEKARLLFAIMSFDAPHLLLLDEPTNHLDIDAREALVQALNNFSGAVVMVSHDPSMVERVADSLWLVNDGSCRPFDGDLEDYRKFIVECRRNARRDEKARKENAVKETAAADTPPVAAPASKPTPANKRDIEKLEKEIAKLTAEKEKLENEMSQPGFYDKVDAARNTQKEYDAVIRDLAIKEEKWLNING